MRPRDDEPYTLNDLVRHEKRQSGFLLLLLVAAAIYFALGGRGFGPDEDERGLEPASPAPTSSEAPVTTRTP